MVRQHVVSSSSGVSLAYSEYCPSGTPIADIVLLHGLASSGRQFVREAERFADQGYRVLVPDLRGHGLSGVPNGAIQHADFSIATLAGDLLGVLDHAKAQDVHWVGNSLGGILALYLLGTADAGRLRSLALFGTCFSLDLPASIGLALRAAFLPGRAITARLTAISTTSNPTGRAAIAAAVKQFNIDAGAAIAANIRRYDFVENARAFPRPLLVMWGGLDRAVNLRLRGDLAKLADCPSLLRIDLPLGGHCANFDMHELFCETLLEHWTRSDASPTGEAACSYPA